MDVSELLRQVNIVDYISQYVDLEKKGEEWWGLSCFKDEKTPSFSVREDPPFFYDYSSGFGGNLVTFVKKYHHCSGRDAVDKIKEFAGIDGDVDVGAQRLVTTSVCKMFRKHENTVKKSCAKILADDYMNRYEDNQDKLKVWTDEGISEEAIKQFQVKYDAFSDRIVYPIRNVDGKIVNIGGRALDPLWKEKGQKKYCYFFSWGTIDTIYGLYENMEAIQREHEIILFEGCKSVLIANSWGLQNTGAILTSHLNIHQMRLLARLGCKVVFALDKDVDVRLDKHIEKLKRYVLVETLRDKDGLLDAKDSPVDKGVEVFCKLYENRERIR